MIVYEHGFLGLGTLRRIHGSAAYKVILPALFSTGILYGYHTFYVNHYGDGPNIRIIQHPYAIGALIAFYSFLLTFRLNFAYMRYWEAATAVHSMLSKWLDCGMIMAAFHYQSAQYKDVEPPSFGELAKQFDDGIIPLDLYKLFGRDRDYRGPESYQEAIQKLQLQQQQQKEQPLGLSTTSGVVTSVNNNNNNSNNESIVVENNEQTTTTENSVRATDSISSKVKHGFPLFHASSSFSSNSSKHNRKSHRRRVTEELADLQQLEANATAKYIGPATSGITISIHGHSVHGGNDSIHGVHSSNIRGSSSYHAIDENTPIPIPKRFQSMNSDDDDDNDDQDSDSNEDDMFDTTTITADRKKKSFFGRRTSSNISSGSNDSDGGGGLDSSINSRSGGGGGVDRRRQKMLKKNKHAHGVYRESIVNTQQAHRITPSLFLQEGAHLLSLLSAVALSTLRNDVECASLPITDYCPGYDQQTASKYHDMYVDDEPSKTWAIIYFLLGISRSPKRRTLYNASRPLGVLGGVSDDEVQLLERARGPYAKVALVTMWLEEFISREYLHGSTGTIAPPIITRLYAITSDGTVAYNQARKIAYVPFPFPNAQIASFFSMAIIFIFPLLYDEYVNRYWFSFVMNFVTVLCFLGLHEVARELENPFINVPNDLPLTKYQEDFNDALLMMYAGFHPDSYWQIKPVNS